MKKHIHMSLSFKEEAKLLKRDKQIHSTWYKEKYPDVVILGMDAAEHFVKYGDKMGRSPRKDFDIDFYINTYPEVLESEFSPFMHYLKIGRFKGYRKAPVGARKAAETKIKLIKNKLLGLGLSNQALVDMKQLAEKGADKYEKFYASREVALWYMRNKNENDYKNALSWLELAKKNAFDDKGKCTINTAFLLSYYHLNDFDNAEKIYDSALKNFEVDDNVKLAWSNFYENNSEKLEVINNVLSDWGISPLAICESDSLPIYDRLTAKLELPVKNDGPKVTVLLATYNAETTIGTALRSLQDQTYKNLEILVLDDCSSDETESIVKKISKLDSRIKYIKMLENLGAYVARNNGLDIAEGEYVTIHDADDWSHPQKIQRQVEYLKENKNVVGCTSEQARAFSNLSFTRWTGPCHFIITNTSSFMFRKDQVKEYAGYWDTVRFSADNELIRRLQKIFGKNAVQHLKTGPLSFQRDSHTSIIADEVLGINGFLFGARKEYHDAQRYYHASAVNLKFSGRIDERPFKVPKVMEPRRIQGQKQFLNFVVAGDFRISESHVDAAIELIKKGLSRGDKVGVVELYSYSLDTSRNAMPHSLRKFLDENDVSILTYGESIVCEEYYIIDKASLSDEQKYKANISYNDCILYDLA